MTPEPQSPGRPGGGPQHWRRRDRAERQPGKPGAGPALLPTRDPCSYRCNKQRKATAGPQTPPLTRRPTPVQSVRINFPPARHSRNYRSVRQREPGAGLREGLGRGFKDRVGRGSAGRGRQGAFFSAPPTLVCPPRLLSAHISSTVSELCPPLPFPPSTGPSYLWPLAHLPLFLSLCDPSHFCLLLTRPVGASSPNPLRYLPLFSVTLQTPHS